MEKNNGSIGKVFKSVKSEDYVFQWYDALWIDFRMGHMMNSLPRIKSEWGRWRRFWKMEGCAREGKWTRHILKNIFQSLITI